MSIESRSRQYGKVFDHWQIKEFLGSGSGGKTAVFRLVRSDSNRGVSALKVVNLIEVRGDINNLSEFRRKEYETARDECSRNAEQEVWLMDDLRGNTNIVDYLDHTFVDWSDDTGFGRDLLIRMELLKDLRSELQNGRAFSEREVLKIGSDICIALIRCHRKNILHRDIKPENIFRNKDGDYKLGDFGVSRVLDACPGAVASTGIGTYEYWPAEQMTGRYDKRVDIYSLGLVLYELCNQNRLPFASSTYVTGKEVSMRLAGTPLPEPIAASLALSEVILKACAFEPEERYQSAEDLLRALNRVICRVQGAAEQKTSVQPASGGKKTEYATVPAESSEVKKAADKYRTMSASADESEKRNSFSTESVKKKTYATEPAEKHVLRYGTHPSASKRENKISKIWIILALLGLCMVSFCATVLVMDHLVANSYGMDRKYSDESGVNNTTRPSENIDQTLEIVQTEQEETTEATTEAITVETTVPPMTEEDIINILVVGDSSNSQEETKMGNTTILVSVNTYNSTATLYSVLRDSYVKLPDYRGHVCGRAKFNVCYHLGYVWGDTAGAMEMTNICVKENFGVEVDHNIEIDMEGFINIIDYLGGVEIELTEAEAIYLNEDDQYVLYDVEPGLQYLDGKAALAYARIEKDNDFMRATRQRHLIEVLLDKVRDLSLSELQDIADALLPMITTTMTPGETADILMRVLPLVKDLKIVSDTIPVSGTYWGETIDIYDDGIPDNVIMFDAPQQKELIRAITEAEIN